MPSYSQNGPFKFRTCPEFGSPLYYFIPKSFKVPKNIVRPSLEQVQAFLFDQTVDACEAFGQNLPQEIIFGQI
jgi:hypothetical protein